MGKSILDSCGRYTEKLLEISEAIVKTRTESGEKVTETDIWTIDSNIFEAYQLILGTVKDPNIISKSIENLKESIQTTGSISNINSIAIASVEKSIEENNNVVNYENNNITKENIINTIITAEIISNNADKLDNIFNSEMLVDLQTEINKIKLGDKNAYDGMIAFQSATKALGKYGYENLEVHQEKILLINMMKLAAANKSQANMNLLIQMSEKSGYNLLKQDSTGKAIIDEEKLTKLYQSKMPEGSKASKMTISDFKPVNERIGEKARTEKRLFEEDISPIRIKENAQSASVKENVRKSLMDIIYKNEEVDLEKITRLYEKYPDIVKEFLKQRIETCNKMQESGRKPTIISKVQKEISLVGDVIKTSDKNLNIPKAVNKNIEDDGLFLE